MTPAPFFSPPNRRRFVVLGALTVLLHVLAIDWLGGHIGLPAAPRDDKAERPIVVELLPEAPARPEPVAQPALLQPVLEPAPKLIPPPLPPLPPVLPDPVAVSAPPAPPAAADSGATQAGAAASAAAVQSATVAPAPDNTPAAAPAKPAPPAAPGPVYKVDVPPPAEFVYSVKRIDADGTKWNGEAAMSWQHDAGHYQVRLEIGISVLITRINLLVSTSAGALDAGGLAPAEATEKRKGRAMTATHFNRDKGTITFSASERSFPLAPGSQDKTSVPFQLAAIGRGDVNQFAGNIDILVGEDQAADLFRFRLVGQDELDTPLGKLVTWHLSRPPRPGSYSSQLDIWLAPSLGWYPVQIQNKEASGALTTQTVTKITPTD